MAELITPGAEDLLCSGLRPAVGDDLFFADGVEVYREGAAAQDPSGVRTVIRRSDQENVATAQRQGSKTRFRKNLYRRARAGENTNCPDGRKSIVGKHRVERLAHVDLAATIGHVKTGIPVDNAVGGRGDLLIKIKGSRIDAPGFEQKRRRRTDANHYFGTWFQQGTPVAQTARAPAAKANAKPRLVFGGGVTEISTGGGCGSLILRDTE